MESSIYSSGVEGIMYDMFCSRQCTRHSKSIYEKLRLGLLRSFEVGAELFDWLFK